MRHLTFSALVALCAATPALAQITPSGQTNTTVTGAVGTRQTVNIAPSLPGGLSYNSYNAFNVGTAGAYFDNRSVGARSIVNQVITTNRSVIQGPVEVLGSRAHVILANPNGITVDGGSFINTGGVVLSTGAVTLQTRTPAPYLTQTNAILSVGGGDILIGPGGLGGTMASLQLYAGSIKVDGPVKVTAESTSRPAGDLQLLAGKSSIEFDSAVLPIAALGNWATVTRKGTTSNEVLVEITSRGGLEASQVYVGVTEDGAGVSYAGTGLASAGTFKIDGSGKVGFTGAQITTATDFKVKGSEITVLNSPAVQSKLIAVNGALTLIATKGDLTNIGGLLQGNTRSLTDTDSKGAVTLTAAHDITFKTPSPDRLAVAFADNDDLVVTATTGQISNTSGRFLSNKATTLTAKGDITNQVTVSGAPAAPGQVATYSQSHRGKWWQLYRRRTTSGLAISYGTLTVPNQLAYIVGSSVTMTGANVVNRGGEIDANSGAVKIFTGQLTNDGVVTGSVAFDRVCQWTCTATGQSTLAINGGRINASTDITVVATAGVTNTNGQWTALQNLTITTPTLGLTGVTLYSVVQRPSGLGQLFQGSTAWVTTSDSGGALLAGGTATLNTQSAVTVDGGLISAKSVVTPAGITTVRAPKTDSPVRGHTIGVLSGWAQSVGGP
jgi:filamentous hemagglutinin family protein